MGAKSENPGFIVRKKRTNKKNQESRYYYLLITKMRKKGYKSPQEKYLRTIGRAEIGDIYDHENAIKRLNLRDSTASKLNRCLQKLKKKDDERRDILA